MGMIRHTGTPGEWSAAIQSVSSVPDTSDPVLPVYLNMTLRVKADHEADRSPNTGRLRPCATRTTVIQQGKYVENCNLATESRHYLLETSVNARR
jgi:hypothetical protein